MNTRTFVAFECAWLFIVGVWAGQSLDAGHYGFAAAYLVCAAAQIWCAVKMFGRDDCEDQPE